MNEKTNEHVVDTFLDGEPVDPVALRDALATSEGRDYLVDLLVLRRAVADMGPMVAVTAAPQRSKPARLARWTAAAAVLLTASVSAFWLGQLTVTAEPQDARSGVEVVLDTPQAAPRPTETIRLVPGTSWHEEKVNQR